MKVFIRRRWEKR